MEQDLDHCADKNETRCKDGADAIVQKCKLAGGCLQWLDSFVCETTNLCTGAPDVCLDGACEPASDPNIHCDTPDEVCIASICDPLTGQCSELPADDFDPCDDGNSCTINDICFNGDCLGDGKNPNGSLVCPKADCLKTLMDLDCGDSFSFPLADSKSNQMSEYDCDGAGEGYQGFEQAMLVFNEYPLSFEMTVTLELANPTLAGVEFSDVMVLGTSKGICWPADCEHAGFMDDKGHLTLKVPMEEEAEWAIVVDGRNGFTGGVRIGASCLNKVVESFCSNGEDDEPDFQIDGFSDCDDPDCTDTLVCEYEQACGDDADNDGDGLTDCADDDCAAKDDCKFETNCFNDIDDDDDGLTDCDDEDDCALSGVCGLECPDAIPLGCGDVLAEQNPLDGAMTWTSFGCSPTGGDFYTYSNPHLIYFAEPEPGCDFTVHVTPTPTDQGFTIHDVYALGPGCNHMTCIDATESFASPESVSVKASESPWAWIAVLGDDQTMSVGDHSYSIQMTCECP